MKKSIIILCTLLIVSCDSYKRNKKAFDVSYNVAKVYAQTIDEDELKENLYKLASDEFEGRDTGSEGQKKAANFLAEYYIENGIYSPLNPTNIMDKETRTTPKNSFFQKVAISFLPQSLKNIESTENVVAYIKGSEYPDEVLVISAHYDHIGKKDDKIYNGADDDASGTVAVMEIAEAFQNAVLQGRGPKRTILFLHVTAEEKGLYGSKWYVENPIFPLKNHIANLNIDMIGRVDEAHKNNKNYVYLIGSDKLSSDLHNWSEDANNKNVQLNLDYRYNDTNDPNRFYYRSDHYNFAKNGIPVIFYFNGVHPDYHKHTDTPEKINYELLEKRTKLVFYTAWKIANAPAKPRVDSNKK